MKLHKPLPPRNQWNAPIRDYVLLTRETCKILLDQSITYFEETIAESEELTQRSSRMLFLLLPGITAVVGYCISNQDKLMHFRNFDIFLVLSITGCLTFCLYNLFTLISPKKIHYRGSKPEDMIRKEIFDLIDKDEIEKAIYVSEIERYQIKIEQMEFWNSNRIYLYRDFIISFNLMIVLGIILLARSI